MRRVGCVLVILVGLAGCGSGGDDAAKAPPTATSPVTSAPTVSRPTKTTPPSTSPASAASTSTWTPPTQPPVTTTGPSAPTSTSPATPTLWCTPHTPTTHVVNSYYGLPTPAGPSIDYRLSQLNPTHDDQGNTIQQVGLSVEMTGPGGTVTLTHGGPTNEVVLRGWGDFNGDGRNDLLVDVVGGQAEYATFIVLSTVGPGTHDPFTVGIRVPHPIIKPGGFEAFPAPVGDQNGDGADDISFGPKLYSGRQLTALPAGAALPAPFRTLASQYVGLLQIDANKPPSFVLLDQARASLRVLDLHSDQLLLNVGPTDVVTAIPDGATATGWLVDNHYIVQFSYGSRAGGTLWRWDLNSACGT